MSGTFLVCLIVAIAAVAYWQVTLIVILAAVLALLTTGLSTVAEGLTGNGFSPPASAIEHRPEPPHN